ncbi:hypothetical protein RHMOL_Rhmol07G0062500 [Rhododendron molle]|uniref:Uncharacterized protein n=1 Tax=Rhododendron molle TaxID=49168 RepID=A0ACC0MZP3_RHOML|nr:hypothetical protein RHMOL_Rhmol07G0062500 [Rhododendron molle]
MMHLTIFDRANFGVHVELDELYMMNVSEHRTDAGKASPETAQYVVQHETAQHAPLIRITRIQIMPIRGNFILVL